MERAIRTRDQWIIAAVAVVVIALAGGGYWYFSYRPAAQRNAAAYAALDRITLPEGWRVTDTLEDKNPSGKPLWTRFYIAPSMPGPAALSALSERFQQVGALPGQNLCGGAPNCVSLVYPPKYRMTVGADDRNIAHESTCPEVPSCTQLMLSMEEWQPGDPD
ncbi:hypothetical protein KZZ52_23370 [Dactylosporangium sp. AC04546]|uniref:hypothetical protein n=1 Tax=Dactylosporangium sp. AC04546 TaxID=2862460 RepID=UPI001EDD17C0|nr:hypothetical protein [Dactylosporangium sp. AC04546]WVK88218.1 hypothetical protein KZZ52_23370 [Dactylosporangium sp. AC04546]